jgi:hypothetical protein
VVSNCLFAQEISGSYDALDKLPDWVRRNLDRNNSGINLTIEESVNPFYLEADFNGEGKLDIALFVRNKDNEKTGIWILHGEDRDSHLVGAGIKIEKLDSFDWMDIWKVYRYKTAEKTIFTDNFDIAGSETVKLPNIAISVSQSEGASNLIVWDGKKYIWIHTGD